MHSRKKKEEQKKLAKIVKDLGGQPTQYREDYHPIIAANLCQIGLTDWEIAQFFQVTLSTITNWKQEHPKFLASLKTGKNAADERVERSLYHRALGYSFEAEETYCYQGEIIKTKVNKHVPPDTTAAIFWLKNRRKDLWRDVHKIEHGRAGEFDGLSDEQLLQQLSPEAKAFLLADPTKKLELDAVDEEDGDNGE